MKIVDPHIHLFALSEGDYDWLKLENAPFWPDKKVINNTFVETDLALTAPLEISGFVHIEAGFDNQQPWRELDWLESHCKLPFRSIAFIDISQHERNFSRQFKLLLEYKSLIGCRHILDENALEILSSQHTINNLNLLAQHQLIFDLQMSLTDKPALDLLCSMLSKLPKLKMTVNHAGWPPSHKKSNEEHIESWQSGLKQLALYKQVAIKCSGWEMSDRSYTVQYQEKIINKCIQAFGVDRVMLASNFPLCTLSMNYQQYWQQIIALLNNMHISQNDIRTLCFNNALHWYKLTD